MRRRLERFLAGNALAWLLAGAAALIAFYYYARTVQPGVGPFLDSVEYQTTVAVGGVSHPPGYPLYTFLGQLFTALPWWGRWAPFGDNLAFRLNFMSVVSAAITVLLMARLIYHLTLKPWAAFLGALALAGAVRFWFQATYTELYAVYSLMLTATLLALVVWMQTRRDRYYYLSVILYALSFGVNAPAIMLLPAWLWATLTTDVGMLRRPRQLLITLGLVALAAAQYVYVPWRAFLVGPPAFCNYCPTSWDETPAFLSGQVWRDIHIVFGVAARYWLQRWADSGYQMMLQFWPLGVALGAVGLWELARARWRLAGLFVWGLAGTWLFVVTYNVVDWADFITPVCVFYAPLIGVGMAAVWGWAKGISAEWPPLLQPIRALLLLLLILIPPGLAYATFRNNYPLVDQSSHMIWHWTARDLLGQMPPDAWLLAPPTDTDGFAQSWAMRLVAWTEDLAPGMQLVYAPGLNPPGPPPGYLRWEEAAPDLAQHSVYVIELRDTRLSRYVLLPVTRADGWPVGYQIVGERGESGVTPWISAERWAEVESRLIYP